MSIDVLGGTSQCKIDEIQDNHDPWPSEIVGRCSSDSTCSPRRVVSNDEVLLQEKPRIALSECASSSFGNTCSSSHGQGENDEGLHADSNRVDGMDGSSNTSAGKLPMRVKIFLGIGESVQGMYVVISGYYLNTFLLETACIDPMYVGLIQAIQGLFDAINDPIIGRLSDRTRSRWGRRRPWLLFAAPLLAMFYFAMWNALGPSVPQFWKFIYALTVSMGVSAGITSIQVQIGALVPELTDDYDERTSVSAFRLFLGNMTGFGAALSHNQIVNRSSDISLESVDIAHRYRISGAVFAVTLWASSWITFFGIRERFQPRQESRRPLSLKNELKAVIRNKGFICVVGAYLCGPTAVALIQGNIFMFCKYVLDDPSAIELIIPCVQGTALISMPFWVFMSRRYGKKCIYLIGGTVLFIAVISIYWIEDTLGALVIATTIGACGPIPYLVPYSMLPDVIEEDELRTGRRREGIFVGFFTIVMKIAITGAMTMTNFILKASGYRAPSKMCGADQSDGRLPDEMPDTQPQVVTQFFRVLCGPLPAVFFLIAMGFVWAFPINRAKQLAMAKLAAQARIERCTGQSETSSVTSTHSPRDVKEVTDFIDAPFEPEFGDKALQAMTKDWTQVKYEEYEAQYNKDRIRKVSFESEDMSELPKERRCRCGHLFESEALFCMKCGRRRGLQDPDGVESERTPEEMEQISTGRSKNSNTSTDEGPSSTEENSAAVLSRENSSNLHSSIVHPGSKCSRSSRASNASRASRASKASSGSRAGKDKVLASL